MNIVTLSKKGEAELMSKFDSFCLTKGNPIEILELLSDSIGQIKDDSLVSNFLFKTKVIKEQLLEICGCEKSGLLFPQEDCEPAFELIEQIEKKSMIICRLRRRSLLNNKNRDI